MRTIKTVLFSSAVALALSAGAASAADTASGFNWTGPYVGLNIGGAFNADTRFDQTVGFLPNNTNALTQNLRPTEQTVSDEGFVGGVQAGYNHQFGDFGGGALVAGLETDIAYTDLDKRVVLSNTTNIGPLGAPSATPVTRVNEYRGGLDYLGTVRARVGVAFDRLYVYGTGGLAYGRVDQEVIFYGPNANTTPFFAGRERGGRTGYAWGGGLEYAIAEDSMLNVFHSSGVTLKAEYLHYDLGNHTLTYPGVNGGATIGGYASRVRTDGDLARVGINYKF